MLADNTQTDLKAGDGEQQHCTVESKQCNQPWVVFLSVFFKDLTKEI